MSTLSKADQRRKRHSRMRRELQGTAQRPRLQISRTLHHIYAIVVDDVRGHTLVAASTRQKGMVGSEESSTNIAAAQKVGKAIGEKAKAAGINAVVFDRNGLQYHGRVKALADAAREAGLEF